MKNLFIKQLLILLFISINAIGQDGKFTFTLSTPATTSAGVFKNDSILVRTLWNTIPYKAGTYTKFWDGKDDYGVILSSPASSYKIKVMSNNVKYEWQGTIGNTSDSMTGPSKQRSYFTCMRGLAFGPTYGYYCSGYSEGSPSFAKFNINTPNQKIEMLDPNLSTADINYVATDGIKVYWGALDANVAGRSFVFGTNVNDDSYVNFTNGVPYTPLYRQNLSVIGYRTDISGEISGLAVQKTGVYLFIARKNLGILQVIDKSTGTLVQTLNYTGCKSLSVDVNDNLWMAQGSSVSKFIVNANGTLTASGLSISGLQNPMATQVNSDGTLISVADGGSSQQVKFFNTSTGTQTNILGTIGGYSSDPTVTDNKFYFSDIRKEGLPFIAYQPNGTFWVNDAGNSRVQHYTAARSFIDRMMWMGATYSVFVDKNNPNKVFSGFQEFSTNYNVGLSGTTGWALTKNWGATNTNDYDQFGGPSYHMTLSNGRTYGLIRKGYMMEIIEFPSTGSLRYTNVLIALGNILCSDGSLQKYDETAGIGTYNRFPLTGFDAANNPIWSSVADVLVTVKSDDVIGNPVNGSNTQIFSSTNKVVLFNPGIELQNGAAYHKGYHLGLLQRGANNTYLCQTEKSTQRTYSGCYPKAGWFDVGNLVNNYAGGNVNIIDRNIITSYHGEFWKNSQTNKFNHYYDNGLALGQFGTTRPEVGHGVHGAYGMAGNALTPTLIKDANGDLYIWHGDESDHSGLHRWKISGLNTISEQVIAMPFPTAFALPTAGYLDLMQGLPFNATLATNTAGWTRDPILNDEVNPWVKLWKVNTSLQSYDNISSNDVSIGFNLNTVGTNTVSRDLGTNNVATNWKIAGNLSYPATGVNINNTVEQQFLEVLDGAGKVLASLQITGSYQAPTYIYTNGKVLASGSNSIIENEVNNLLPFEINVLNGAVTFTYGNYAPLTTTIADASGNWKTPATLRVRFTNTGAGGTGYGKEVTMQDFKFYKDVSAVAPTNQAPVAVAGVDQTLTLPINTTNLTGSGTDANGTITNFGWVKIAGPAGANILNAATATTAINNLVQGAYQYELTVTDNNGATGKDTVQITVSLAPNVAPSANGGGNKTITLPTNTVTLAGSGADTDGTISTYAWLKISGPSAGILATSNAATTIVSGMVQGVYQFELTVTDNNGATGKNVVDVTVNAAVSVNLLPAVNPANTVNGLDYNYYEGNWNVLPDFSTLTPVKTGTTANFDLSLANRADQYGFSFTGFIDVPTDGQYTFYASSDDGSNVYIDNVLVVANDGLHATVEQSGVIGLKAGKHAIKGLFFQQSGDQIFTVSYEGMGKTKQNVPANVLYRIAAANIPPVAIAGADKTITLPTNTVTLTGSGTDADGTISGYAWAKISGPASATIVSSTASNTAINNLTAGIYKFELTVTDNNGATAKSTVTITVNAAANVAPSANGGGNKTITLPINTVTLAGSGADTDGTISTYAWIKISGPSAGILATSNAATTIVNGMVQGVYQFELTVTDNNGATGKNVVDVTVNAAVSVNLLPAVYPANTVNGLDYNYYEGNWNVLPDFSTLTPVKTGTTANFDLSLANRTDQYGFNFTGFIDVPTDGQYTFYATSDDGSNVYIDNVLVVANDGLHGSVEQSGVIGLKAGKHAIKGLFFQQSGDKVFTVSYEGMGKIKQAVPANALYRIAAANIPPVAIAGADKTITLPTNTVTLTGSGTDADGTISSYAWAKISGPASATIVSSIASSTAINNLTAGIYKFELTVTDNNGATAKSTVTITVIAAANIPPVAIAGADKTITLPINTITLTGSGTDADGTISSYAWAKISGPASATIVSSTASSTVINNLTAGIYQFELTVTDNNGATAKSTVNITVVAAVIDNLLPTANAGGDISIVLPINAVILKGTGTDADGVIVSYTWKVISGPAGYLIANANLSETRIENLYQGVYTIELTVTDNSGGVSTDITTITVSSPRLSNNTISNEFKVYPNPVKDVANVSIITINASTKVAISVVNLSGLLVKAYEFNTTQVNSVFKIDMSALSNGYYIITLRFDDGRKVSTKVLKQN